MDEVWLRAPSPALVLRGGAGLAPAAPAPRVQPNPAALDWAARQGLTLDELYAVRLQDAAVPGAAAGTQAAADAVARQLHIAGRDWPATAVPLPDGWLFWLHTVPAAPTGPAPLAPARHGPAIEALLGSAAGSTSAPMERVLGLSGVSVWRVDLAARRIHLNAVGLQRLGLPADADGLPLGAVRDTIHPQDRAAVARAAEEALHSDAVIDVRARYRNPDGSWRLMLTRRVADRDAQGRPRGLLGISLDLSEQEAQRERTEALSQRSRLVAEALGVGFWQRDLERHTMVWDEPMYRIHRRDPALGPPQGMDWVTVCVHPDDRPWVLDRARRADAAWEPTTDLLYRAAQPDADGKERWVQSWARRLTRDGTRIALGLHMDVTERIRDRAAHRRAREREQLAIRLAEIGVWERDRSGRISYWNEVMYRQRGLDPNDPRDLELIAAHTVHADDLQALQRMVRAHLERGTPYRHEFRIRLPDGSARWLLSQGQAVRDESGQVLGVVGVNLDITERRQAEALQREKLLLKQLSREKSALMARLSHELRTPMNAVLGFTRLLEDDAAEPPTERQRERLARIARASERLMALIDDVLEVAKLQSQAEAAPTPSLALPLHDLLREVAASVVGEAERCGVQLRWPAETALHGLMLQVDRLRAVQAVGHVLLQLLRRSPRNARLRVRASAVTGSGLPQALPQPPGRTARAQQHVALQIRIDAPRVPPAVTQPTLFGDLDLPAAGTEWSSDTGPGGFVALPAGDMPQVDELALDLARSLLHPMGGDVEWTPQGGAAHGEALVHCTLRLPAQAEGPAPPGTAARAGSPSPPAFAVLCVEDNPVNLQLLCEVLALRPQVRLRTAVDGNSGIAAALAEPPDLLLLDLQLPDLHGIEVMRRLRREPALSGCLFVALSADAMPEHVRAAREAGFDDYWTKPIHFDRFLADIDRLAADRAAARGA